MIFLRPKLWTRDFTLLISATVLGAAGGIAGSFALSFLVYEETGSTLAAALLIAINVAPGFLVPLAAAPFMDRLPRKPFLVGGDAVNGALYAAAGLYLLRFDFTYTGYLCFSLLLSSLSAFDSLAYNSISSPRGPRSGATPSRPWSTPSCRWSWPRPRPGSWRPQASRPYS